jgi:hypothetical protein
MGAKNGAIAYIKGASIKIKYEPERSTVLIISAKMGRKFYIYTS